MQVGTSLSMISPSHVKAATMSLFTLLEIIMVTSNYTAQYIRHIVLFPLLWFCYTFGVGDVAKISYPKIDDFFALYRYTLSQYSTFSVDSMKKTCLYKLNITEKPIY